MTASKSRVEDIARLSHGHAPSGNSAFAERVVGTANIQ
jgi:hypothetical protein